MRVKPILSPSKLLFTRKSWASFVVVTPLTVGKQFNAKPALTVALITVLKHNRHASGLLE